MSIDQGHSNNLLDRRANSEDEMSVPATRVFKISKPPTLDAFREFLKAKKDKYDTPYKRYDHASAQSFHIPIYDAERLKCSDSGDEEFVNMLQDEFYSILHTGPGVFVLRNMYSASGLIEQTNQIFKEIIAREQMRHPKAKGDHFAGQGNNVRIWNSFEKHGLAHPPSFAAYYSNPWLAIICRAWLGPGYRITAQANIVKPGGAAQLSHRDYHLGFQTLEDSAKFPKSMHVASQFLTLQGAIAHTDMPLESGPTRFLPYSQMFEEGFMAYRLPEFQRYFEEEYVSLSLKKGDGVFFNPALFHAAGRNETHDFERWANLVQVSSAFGKPMEQIDSISLVDKCWHELKAVYNEKSLSGEYTALVAALTEGYPFPTNLDRRPPAPSGMAPESESDVLINALVHDWPKDQALDALKCVRASLSC